MSAIRTATQKASVVIWLFAMALSALANGYQWPQKDNGWPKGQNAVGLLQTRFTKASKKALGSDADVVAVKKAILNHYNSEKAGVGDIRWLSPSLVMAEAGWYIGPLASEFSFYALEKKKGKWIIVTYYLLSIS